MESSDQKHPLFEWWKNLNDDWIEIINNAFSYNPYSKYTSSYEPLIVGGKLLDIDTTYTKLSAIEEYERIVINNKKIIDLTPLTSLKNLKIIDCSNTKVSKIPILDQLQYLEVFNGKNTKIKSYDILKFNPKLKCLLTDFGDSLNRTQVESFIQYEKTYHHLYNWWYKLSRFWQEILYNQIMEDKSGSPEYAGEITYEALCKIANLKALSIHASEISDLEPLSELTLLEMVDCSGTSVENLNPLRNLINLRYLYIQDTKIKTLLPVRNLSNLEIIICIDTLISKEDLHKTVFNFRNLKILFTNEKKYYSPVEIFGEFNPNSKESHHLYSWWCQLNDEWKAIFDNNFKLYDKEKSAIGPAIIGAGALDIDITWEKLCNIETIIEIKFHDFLVKDIEPLRKLIELQIIDFSHFDLKQLSDIDLTPLLNLTNLLLFKTKNSSFRNIPELLEFINSVKK